MPDIDVDFANREDALRVLKHIKASRISSGQITAHNTGIYLQDIPHNPVTNLSNIDYKQAEERGYFKIDFLNVNVYKNIKDEEHLTQLMNREPLWELLLEQDFVDMLFQLSGHTDILKITRPTSIEQLAAVLAMIRPAKKYLIGKSWKEIMDEVWTKPSDDQYYWKKSHAFAYAVAIVVQMNEICESIKDA